MDAQHSTGWGHPSSWGDSPGSEFTLPGSSLTITRLCLKAIMLSLASHEHLARLVVYYLVPINQSTFWFFNISSHGLGALCWQTWFLSPPDWGLEVDLPRWSHLYTCLRGQPALLSFLQCHLTCLDIKQLPPLLLSISIGLWPCHPLRLLSGSVFMLFLSDLGLNSEFNLCWPLFGCLWTFDALSLVFWFSVNFFKKLFSAQIPLWLA